MLQRSKWSGLLMSAAVCAATVLGASAASAQETQAAAAPASAPAVSGSLETLADDFMHYSLVNNVELARANAEAILANPAPAEEVLKAFEARANGRDPRAVIEQDLRRDPLKDVAQKLQEKLDVGFRALARDPKRIRAEVDRLANGPRGYQNARDRLMDAGQYAAPIFIEYLQDGTKNELHPFILRVMAEIGRPLLLPLIEELRVGDPTLKIELVNVIGQIRYPQALPALRTLQADESTTGELKAAVEAAIRLIDTTGQAMNMSPSDLNLKAAENYYDKKPSYQPLNADEKTNPIWVFDAGLKNVTAMQVPTPIWNSVMALRLAEATLKQDANNGDAISLWLAANLRREIQLPAGETDPTHGNGPDASFYVLAAGPVYVNKVLARALDARDSALALRAVDGLEATGGVTGLVSGGEHSPLVRALSYPDRAVRYRAAFALARANPVSQFPSFFRVVPILTEAVNSTGSPTALLISPDDDTRNKMVETLRNSSSHYQVFAGANLSEALDQARRAPGIDVVIVANGPDVNRISEMARQDYRLSGAPVLVTAPAANLENLKLQLGQTPGFGAIDQAADEPAITAALNGARSGTGAAMLDADKAQQYASTSLELLGMLAADHRSIYNVLEAVPTLTDALRDKRTEIATAAARVLGKISSPDGERALATVALGSDVDPALRIALLDSLAESAKRTGNSLDASQVNSLIKVVSSDPDPKVRVAAATALGALNVPSNQASTLILQQAK